MRATMPGRRPTVISSNEGTKTSTVSSTRARSAARPGRKNGTRRVDPLRAVPVVSSVPSARFRQLGSKAEEIFHGMLEVSRWSAEVRGLRWSDPHECRRVEPDVLHLQFNWLVVRAPRGILGVARRHVDDRPGRGPGPAWSAPGVSRPRGFGRARAARPRPRPPASWSGECASSGRPATAPRPRATSS